MTKSPNHKKDNRVNKDKTRKAARVPDTLLTLLIPVVTSISSTVTALGSVETPPSAPGRTESWKDHEGPADLAKKKIELTT